MCYSQPQTYSSLPPVFLSAAILLTPLHPTTVWRVRQESLVPALEPHLALTATPASTPSRHRRRARTAPPAATAQFHRRRVTCAIRESLALLRNHRRAQTVSLELFQQSCLRHVISYTMSPRMNNSTTRLAEMGIARWFMAMK